MGICFKTLIKRLTHVHLTSSEANIIIFSTPRSGSTWLMEIMATRQRSKIINEPLNLRAPFVKKYSGMISWNDNIDLQNRDKIILYINKLINGKLSFKNPSPTSSYYKAFTNHSVVKILHGGENMINDILYGTNSKGVFLIRHPIPVSLSRKQLPRLESFIFSGSFNDIGSKKLKFAKRVFEKGDFFEKAVLDWCFQNYYPLTDKTREYEAVSYETLVVNPVDILGRFAKKKLISNISKATSRINKPSKTTYQSSEERKRLLEPQKIKVQKEIIVNKWMSSISEESVIKTQNILEVFEIDYYKADSPYPKKNN